MKFFILFFLTFFFLTTELRAQTNEEIVQSTNSSLDISGQPINSDDWQSSAGGQEASSTSESSSNKGTSLGVGTTPANLTVSFSGSAIYTIPLSTPPGIRDINPNIALAFNSQASNGIAGWGWNISGLSTISRVSSTQHHDGYIDGVEFDANDRFALDGQRLMVVNGTYGATGSEYKTENYSNIKIKAYGTSPYGSSFGPSYFIVYYPDGSRAWYGNGGSSRGKLEWAIYKKQDPQGNFINYFYTTTNGLISIDRIEFGSRVGMAAPVKIQFIYENRVRPELAYVNGYSFKRTNILKRIEVYGNQQLYRKYILTHDETPIGYQRLVSLQEFNKDNEGLSPISFTYQNAPINQEPAIHEGSIYPGFDYENDQIISGEFTGDGEMDFILDKGNGIAIFHGIFGFSGAMIGTSYNLPIYDEIIPNKMLNSQGKLLSQSGITLIHEAHNSGDYYSNVSFKSYYKGSTGLYYQYTKTWNAVTYNYVSSCGNEIRKKIPKKYISGDFNGDGMTDIIAIQLPYTNKHCQEYDCLGKELPPDDPPGSGKCCTCSTYEEPTTTTFFIDLNRNLTDNFASYAGGLQEIVEENDRLIPADFNGDGKTDLFHFKEGKVYIYELDSNNDLVLIHSENDSYIKMDRPILMGDYNGDGKIDFIVPTAYNSKNWRFFLSKGADIKKYTKAIDMPFNKNQIDYSQYPTDHGTYLLLNSYYETKYIPLDFNNDGKTDIIGHQIVSSIEEDYDNSKEILTTYTNLFLENENQPTIKFNYEYRDATSGIGSHGTPIFLNSFNDNAYKLQYGYISTNHLSAYEFKGDHQTNTVLKKISNNGIVHDLEYVPLTITNDPENTYSKAYDQIYPFINVNIAPSLKLVKKVTESDAIGSIVREQDFKYSAAVSHGQGLGFLGFELVKKSNWHGTGVGTVWNMSKFDMQKRGAIAQEWMSTFPYDTPINYYSKTDYTYQTQLTSNKVFINAQTEVVIEDALQNITTVKTFDYDANYNPETISTTFPGGSTTVNFVYSDNLAPFNKYYHVGRLSEKTVSKVLSGETFTTQNKYIYNNNLIVQSRKKGNNTDWIDEYYQYDIFGNVIQKKLSTPDITDRIESFEFDSSGRYMTKSIGVDGLETTYTYEASTGNPTSTTDPYGLTTTYGYDAWQRLIQTTNYLGVQTLYSYENGLSPGSLIKTTDFEEGQDERTLFNSFGWITRQGKLALDNKWVYKTFEYDVAGRKIKESEPYFGTASPSQWNEFEYDIYGRPIAQTLYTGKTITTSYNGLSVTVDDGTKTVTTTKDALGNIVTLTDPGGTIHYAYYANGSLKSADYGGHAVTTSIDGWGRKTALNDPSAGNYTYSYNSIGELLQETTPKGSTSYQYDAYGKLLSKEIIGDQTHLVLDYYYDPGTKQLTTIDGTDQVLNRAYTYTYSYDAHQRPITVSETTDEASYQKIFSYDAHGRISTESYITLFPGTNNVLQIKNSYDTNGYLIEKRDLTTNHLLWKINEQNARGQALQMELGNGVVQTREYDQFGLLSKIRDLKIPQQIAALEIDYDFDPQRGNLDHRKNYAFGGWEENFSYDQLDRLTTISGDVSHAQQYDDRGRISSNSWVGDYSGYSNTYQAGFVDLNDQGDLYYQQHALQTVTYNAFKKPVEVYEEGQGRVSFEYGPLMNRTRAYYGGDQTDKTQRRYHKYYSSIMPVEIVEDMQAGTLKIISYIGGDAYSAPVVHLKTDGMSQDLDTYFYLHRDYLGSILAISDENGNVVERRHFGAWGEIAQYWSSTGNPEFNHESFLGRGFTGHEHFFEVGLIHMNGRMYDAHLHQFLSPDDHIQAPYSTQSFNRFGYVWNNPLKYTDASGEFLGLAIAIGAAVGAYFGGVQANGGEWAPWKWEWNGDTVMGVVGGAIVGGAAGGVGAIVGGSVAGLLSAAGIQGGILGGAITGIAGGAVGGAISGFGMAGLPGGSGKPWQGAWKGAVMGAAMGGIIGGAIGGFSTPKGYNILTGTRLRPTVEAVSEITPRPIIQNTQVNEAIPDTGPIHYKSTYYSTKVTGADGAHNWNRTTIEIVADNGEVFSIMYKGRPQTLIQFSGNRFGQEGVFELVIEKGVIHHQIFVPNGVINGIPSYMNATFKGLNFGVNWFNVPTKNPLIPNWETIIKP